jgi:hypothetical protein
MTPEENARVIKLENTVSLLISLNNLALQQLSSVNEISLVMASWIKSGENFNSELFQTVVNDELRQFLSKQQSLMSFKSDQCNTAIRNSTIGCNNLIAVANRALEAAKSGLLPGLNPIPIINLPSEFSGQCDSGTPPAS